MMGRNKPRLGYQRWLLLQFLLQNYQYVFCFGANNTISESGRNSVFPASISLNVGIFLAPPYAFDFKERQGGGIYASGFAPDLLDSLQVFAAQDGVNLTFQLREAPPSYNGALDLIANDCNTTDNPHMSEACELFDVLAMDYYHTTARAMRIEYTPPYLQGAISAARYVPELAGGEGAESETTLKFVDATGGTAQSESTFMTMSQASDAGHPVCLVAGTSIVPVAMEEFPGADYVMCFDQQACLDHLKNGDCQLYLDDRLQLLHRSLEDSSLVVNFETFNPQFVTWVMNERTLQPIEMRLLKRWLIAAHQNGTTTELYEKYFEKQACPIGTAGPDCTLPCSSLHGAANVHGQCVCKSPKWTGPDCSTAVPEELNLIPQPLKVLAYCLVGINCLAIVGCGAWLYGNRDDKQVHMSQPSFLLMVLLGCLISSSTIIPMAHEPDSDSNGMVACMAIPWLYSVGFCVTFGTLFAKIRRVYIIFKSSAECKRINVSFLETLSVVGLVLLVDVIILLVWTLVDPLKWQRVVISEDQFGEPLESEGYCTSEHWVTFGGTIAGLHLFLLLVASCLCFASRHIPPKFSVAKHVSVAIVSNLQILVVGIPVLIVAGSQPTTSFFLRSVIVWMNDLVVVCLIFGGLIWAVKSGHEATNEEILHAIQEFSKHQSADDMMDISLHSALSGISQSLPKITNIEIPNSLPKLHSGLSGIANIELPNRLPAVFSNFRSSNVSDLSSSLRSANTNWKDAYTSTTTERTSFATNDMSASFTDQNLDDNSAMTRKKGFPRKDFLDKDSWAIDNLGETTIMEEIQDDNFREEELGPVTNQDDSK